MRFAQVVRDYHKRGGVSRVVAELTEHLLALGHELHIYANRWDPDSPKEISFHKVPTFPLTLPLEVSSFTYFSTLLLKRANYDIVNNHGDCRHKGIFTCHGSHTYFVNRISRHNPSSLDKYTMRFEDYIFNQGNYTKIIAVSKLVKNQILEMFGVPEKDIAVVYNGSNLEDFSPNQGDRDAIRSQYHINKDEMLLLFVSHDFKNKGLDTIIKALGLLKKHPFKLLIVGKDREGTKPDKFLKMAEDLGIKDKIIFAGASSEVQKFFHAADIFVFPTDIDSFGLVELEALASGLPVIVSSAVQNGFAEIITDGKDGLILSDHQNPEEIAGKIRLLMENETLRKIIGQAALETAKEYSWDKVAQRTLEVYKTVISSH
jgi:UDP-glucose:(heptosyl)LPS alpha-1,3-glucosyltransferase